MSRIDRLGRRESLALLGVRNALIKHLKRANDASHVMGMDALRALRIASIQKLIERIGTVLLSKALISPASVALDFTRGKPHIIKSRHDIEACSAA